MDVFFNAQNQGRESAAAALEELLGFAINSGLIFREDVPYCRNLLLDVLKISEPFPGYNLFEPSENEKRETAKAYLDILCGYAVNEGLTSGDVRSLELFSARIMGCLTLPPSSVQSIFNQKVIEGGKSAATDWFYGYSRKSNYIQVDAIAKNIEFEAPSPYGEIKVTINLSKPEYDLKLIEAAAKKTQGDYPKCALCVENTGNAGDAIHAPRQNHRMIPITLGGENWHLQYSPYLYYNEHCIALSDQHTPMKIDRDAFVKLLDFVDFLPHYFIGSNSDLPLMSGSIISHIHFQGGRYHFPMDKAPDEIPLSYEDEKVAAALVKWPMTCIRLRSKCREALTNAADRVLIAWQGHSDKSADIIAETDQPHNTLTPIARMGAGDYILNLVLRNNRMSEEHPTGIFHPHQDLHHIKKENIGLIEVMGLFILPGRLKSELKILEDILCGKAEISSCPELHMRWLLEIIDKHGKVTSCEAEGVIRNELAKVCRQILEDAGVYKDSPEGRAAFMRFWETI
ncbi:MAG: UDP-glucose--hexose-1-phosphate uridylyltransferase [Christensenellales bacterium]|jgi:UDPglucose--hexose-1-phosphate uridylyltransferase